MSNGHKVQQARYQTAVPGDDHQEHEEILHLWGDGARRQEREEAVPGQQLSEYDACKAVHLHNAHEAGRRMESNSSKLKSIQSFLVLIMVIFKVKNTPQNCKDLPKSTFPGKEIRKFYFFPWTKINKLRPIHFGYFWFLFASRKYCMQNQF